MSEVEDKLRDLLQSLERERQKKPAAEGEAQLSEKEMKAIRQISERHKAYVTGINYSVGSIVKWKRGMRNRRFPNTDEVAICTYIYPSPIYDENSKDSGTPQFHDPMSVVLGVIDDDGDFVEFHYDGNRFELATTADVPPRASEQLRNRFASLCAVEHFEVGDAVTWKEGLRNKKHPVPGTAALVVEILPEPLRDKEANSGSPYFNEPLGFVIGIVDDDGDLLCFHSDPRRFTKIPDDF